MPNGFHGEINEWKRLEASLLEIDDNLLVFAKKYKMKYSKNYHNWPSRSLEWHKDNMRKLIQIYLSDENKYTFNLWLCASEDRENERFLKKTFLKKEVMFDEIKNNLIPLLEEGHDILASWKKDDLEFATKL